MLSSTTTRVETDGSATENNFGGPDSGRDVFFGGFKDRTGNDLHY